MTCVVGMVRGGGVWLAADSGGYGADSEIFRYSTPKVWRWGDILFGGAGSWRAMQVLQQYLCDESVFELRSQYKDAESFLVQAIIPQISMLFTIHFSDPSVNDWTLLLGFEGSLYLVESDYLCIPIMDGYCAIGSAEREATGALAVLSSNKRAPPGELLRRALEAVEKHSGVCTPPFLEVSIVK